jgi:hypothetical protein
MSLAVPACGASALQGRCAPNTWHVRTRIASAVCARALWYTGYGWRMALCRARAHVMRLTLAASAARAQRRSCAAACSRPSCLLLWLVCVGGWRPCCAPRLLWMSPRHLIQGRLGVEAPLDTRLLSLHHMCVLSLFVAWCYMQSVVWRDGWSEVKWHCGGGFGPRLIPCLFQTGRQLRPRASAAPRSSRHESRCFPPAITHDTGAGPTRRRRCACAWRAGTQTRAARPVTVSWPACLVCLTLLCMPKAWVLCRAASNDTNCAM